jgi:geranylgeranyl pyrophosphate synthase
LAEITSTDKLQLVREQMDVYLKTLVPGTPKSLYDPVRYIIEAGGKRLRPALTYFSSLGDKNSNWMPAAAAVELLHTFTLVHDDIMDNSSSRRGLATMHEKYGLNTAILSGDVLIALAEHSLAMGQYAQSSKMMMEFATGFRCVCEGQALDKEFEHRNDVTTDEYFTMIGLKSAKLIELSAVLGGYASGSTAIEPIRVFAHELGLAFQLRDDLLDLTAEHKTLGKPIGGDIVEGKRTYLYLKARQSYDSLEDSEKKLLDAIANREAGWGDVAQTRALFEKTGAIAATLKRIEFHTQSARTALISITDNATRTALAEFSEYLLHREN